jgi:hypothetical protein
MSRDLFSTEMKCPLRYDAEGRPVSPGSSLIVVGPSAPALPNGTIRIDSTRSLAFLESSDTIRTECRRGGSPSFAVQISPRRGAGLIVEVNLVDPPTQGGLHASFLSACPRGQPLEVGCGIRLEAGAALGSPRPGHGEIDGLSEVPRLAPSDERSKVGEALWRDGGGHLASMIHRIIVSQNGGLS